MDDSKLSEETAGAMDSPDFTNKSSGTLASRSSDSRCRNVYLLITPLKAYHTYNLQQVDFSRKRCPNKRVPFRRLQHWAIQVGDDVQGEMYEVTSYYRSDHIPELNMITAEKWRETRHKHISYARKMFITVTELSSNQLKNIATALWDTVLEDRYQAFSRNCQSFAELFRAIIHSHHLLTDEDHMEIQDVPASFNPFYVVMHLKQAHVITARWTRRLLRREQTPATAGAIPGRRSGRWLEHVNEAAKQHEFHEGADIRAIIQEANRMRKDEKKRPLHVPDRKPEVREVYKEENKKLQADQRRVASEPAVSSPVRSSTAQF